ncbi:MAG TPA: intradiol ring-cleavage dioxygenase [Gemmatimonadaceae bacterium]
MDNDDVPIGRVLDRREAVRLLAMSGAAVLVGCNRGSANAADSSVAIAAARDSTAKSTQLPGCVVKPELTVGPYFLDNQLERRDIRDGKPGAMLQLTFLVSQITGGQCKPLEGAVVDVWHCDASGAYSGFNDRMEGFNTVGQKFLRGYQKTSSTGAAAFTTIYPGWYRGRTVHIHFKIRAPWAPGTQVTDAGKQYDFTSQLFFDDTFTDRVFASAPYNAKGARDLRNSSDGIFRQSGDSLLLNVGTVTNSDHALQGYAATFEIGLDLSDTKVGAEDRMGGPGPGGAPPFREGAPPPPPRS